MTLDIRGLTAATLYLLLAGSAALAAQEPQLISVAAAIQDLDGDFVPDRLGETVFVEGTITRDVVPYGPFGFFTFLQGDAGVVLFAVDATRFHGTEPGHRVRVTGIVGQFRGQEQIAVDSLELIGYRPVPAFVPVPIANLDERFSAQLVEIRGILRVEDVAGQLLAIVTDETGEIGVFLPPAQLADVSWLDRLLRGSGRPVTIRGVLAQDTDLQPASSGYYLFTGDEADFDLPSFLLRPWEKSALLFLFVLGSGLILLGYRHWRAKREATERRAYTDRLRASEAALRVSESRYRGLVNSVPLGLYQVSPEGEVLSANPALTDLLGYSTFEEFSAAGIARCYAWRDEQSRIERDLITAGEVVGIESHWRRRNGEPIVVRQSARAIRGPEGDLLYFEGIVEDLTAHREAEDRLRAAEAHVTQLVATSPTIIYAVHLRNSRTELTWISDSVADILGYSAQEASALSWWADCLHPDDRGNVVREFIDFLVGQPIGTRLTHEYRFRHKDGQYRWFRNDLRIASRDNGEVEAVGASLDITVEKEISLALVHAESRYRRLVETSPYGIFEVDQEGRVLEANPALGSFFGLEAAEVVGRTVRELVASESHPTIKVQMDMANRNPMETFDNEVWIVRPCGERRLVHIRSTSIVRNEAVVGAHGVVRDITEERRRENRVQLLGAALENLGHGVAVSDLQGELIYANSEFMKMLAFSPVSGKLPSLNDFLPDDAARAQLAEIAEALRSTGRWSGRIWRRRATDGKVIPIDAVVGIVPGPDGVLPHALTIYNDASENIEREQQLRRAERLSSLGTMVGGVAHELNNPLNAIINFAALLLTESRSDEERDDLETIVREGERAAKIVSNLRLIARQAAIEKSPKEEIDVNDVVRHVLKLRAYPLANSNIHVATSLQECLPPVWCDRGQMEQVLLNLVVNAEQAMAAFRGEGTLRIVTSTSPLGARIEVIDDGPGIPSSQIDRIFDPFWTTKAPGEGTGLGLSLVHNIVTENGGCVDVRSEAGRGATFQIDMPLPPGKAPADSCFDPEGDEDDLPNDPLRILVVEDEHSVRQSLVRLLSRHGHSVDQASEGAEALRLLDRTPAYDIILSDLRMPGIGGEQLLAKLKQQGDGSDQRVLFMTGDASGAHDVLTDAPLLIKPVTFRDLNRAIRDRVAKVGSAL